MKPNFLILVTDQQRFDTIAAAGHSHMRTPNLDRLVNEGCLFRNGYTPNPICVAARHSLLTGAACRDHGFMANNSIRGGSIGDDALATYPRIFSENGWHTVALGKMHFKPVTEHHGYRQMELMEEIPRDRRDDAYARHLADVGLGEIGAIHGVRPLIYHHPQTALMPEDEHGTFWLGRRASEIIEENADRPWLMTASWIHPHPPLHIPPAWQGHYRDADLPEATPPCRFPPHHPDPGGWVGADHPPEANRAFRESYYTAISMIDHAIGGVLDTLEATGQLERTCILFVSDHGEMLGDNGWYQKGLPYEPSTHIPFIARYPEKFAPGTTDDRFVDLTDIFPTLVDLAGIDFPYKESHRRHDLPGESLLVENGGKDRSVQWVEHYNDGARWLAIRDERYKFIYFYAGGVEQFYDLESDPGERHNLIGTDALPAEAYEHLRERCVEMERKWGPAGYAGHWGGFDDRKALSSGARNACLFTGFANSQLPKMGDKSPADGLPRAQWHVDELLRAIEKQEVRWTASPELKEYFEEWVEKMADHCGLDRDDEELPAIVRSVYERILPSG